MAALWSVCVCVCPRRCCTYSGWCLRWYQLVHIHVCECSTLQHEMPHFLSLKLHLIVFVVRVEMRLRLKVDSSFEAGLYFCSFCCILERWRELSAFQGWVRDDSGGIRIKNYILHSLSYFIQRFGVKPLPVQSTEEEKSLRAVLFKSSSSRTRLEVQEKSFLWERLSWGFKV